MFAAVVGLPAQAQAQAYVQRLAQVPDHELLRSGLAEPEALPGVAFLQNAPRRATGIPVLPSNQAPHIFASYRLDGAVIHVFLVPQPHVADLRRDPRSSWSVLACAGSTLVRTDAVPSGGRSASAVYAATPIDQASQPYALIVSGQLQADTVCSFSGDFLRGFDFFLTELRFDLSAGSPPEFPAIVNVN